MAALARGLRAVAQSRRYTRMCGRLARPDSVAEGFAVWVVDATVPVLALAGVVRPRVVISRGMMEALETEQLSAALRHEEAHRRSRDNLKRLALLLAPEILPGLRAFRALERAWARVTEWAADEGAAADDARRRLALADALVRTVRLGCAPRPAGPLAATLLDDPVDLEARVTRLLEAPTGARPSARYWAAAAGLAAGALAVLLLQPGTLYSVHWLLEGLMR
jgi:Zn-dependent protease with chaperone function